MARAATTTDAFNAVAEPRRRDILDVLAGGERPVNELVARLGLAQPQVSKHLKVLRDAGFVTSRVAAQQRIYELSPAPFEELDDWLEPYRHRWTHHLDALERHLDRQEDR